MSIQPLLCSLVRTGFLPCLLLQIRHCCSRAGASVRPGERLKEPAVADAALPFLAECSRMSFFGQTNVWEVSVMNSLGEMDWTQSFQPCFHVCLTADPEPRLSFALSFVLWFVTQCTANLMQWFQHPVQLHVLTYLRWSFKELYVERFVIFDIYPAIAEDWFLFWIFFFLWW